MSKKQSTHTQRTTPRSFGMLSLAEQVQTAMPYAQAFIEEGIDTYKRNEGHTIEPLAELMRDPALVTWSEQCDEEDLAMWNNRLEAARALGIALGLMLRPEAFTGGAR